MMNELDWPMNQDLSIGIVQRLGVGRFPARMVRCHDHLVEHATDRPVDSQSDTVGRHTGTAVRCVR